ncbi:MAG: discoidin domain-containing protein [Pirellulales bacterium]
MERCKGELYFSQKIFDTAVPLAKAPRQSDNEPQVCVWTNQYHKARVFGTTIGHYNETTAQPEYLDMLTRGLLWSVYGDNYPEPRKPSDEFNKSIFDLVAAPDAPKAGGPQCCNQGNLAFEKSTKASSEESGKKNFAKNAVDGNLNTRWCANGPGSDEWIQVDFGTTQPLKFVRLHWEQPNNAYRYRIEGSEDGEKWKLLSDQSKNDKAERAPTHEVDGKDTRYLKVTFLGSRSGGWGSLFEIEASTEPLPTLADSGSTDSAAVSDVEAPTAFEVRMFAAPPQVNYPVCLTAAADGTVFVGVDEQGSLGKEKGRGKIVRCIDRDGDGRADLFNTFAEIDHPRGLVYDSGRLWVLHPPMLSLLIDRDLDGKADEQKTLLSGISTDQVNQRGADHTTNGIRMGIDGWIYIAVGDFGFLKATGTDGRVMSRRGGGIVRVRPDGSDMEVFSWGQRNILDVCIDPMLNMFTRDNTNDGGGWNVRVTHILQGADYGYPSRYINFADETMPPLADYGGGSGCGAMTVYEPRWPAEYGNAVYTCDWGTSQVYRHRPASDGATFKPDQDVFLKLPRPTDIDIDASGRMLVSSWKNGGFNFSDPNVGFVAQIVPRDFLAKPFPRLDGLDDKQLISLLESGASAQTLPVQFEILRRGASEERRAALIALIQNRKVSLAGRVAAVFTFSQLLGKRSHESLIQWMAADEEIREFAMRALTDRLSDIRGLNPEPIVKLLADNNPRVRAQALISLSRLAQAGPVSGAEAIAAKVLPMAVVRDADGKERTAKPVHDQADAARVIPHLAIRAVRDLGAEKTCLSELESVNRRAALWALREMRSPAVAEKLIQLVKSSSDKALREDVIDLLGRIALREAEYVKGDWWGTRPDTTGPYYDRADWSETAKINTFLTSLALGNAADRELTAAVAKRYRMSIVTGSDMDKSKDEEGVQIVSQKADPNNPNQIGNMQLAAVTERALKSQGDAAKGKKLFTSQSCVACHTTATGETPKGPHLVDIGKRYKRAELVESIVKPSAKIAQGFDTWSILTDEGKLVTGFVVLESAETVTLRGADGKTIEIAQDSVESRKKQEQSMMPTGLVEALTPEQLSDLLAYLESLH